MIGTDIKTGKILEGDAYLSQAIGFVLGTRVGSMVMQREFGSKLSSLSGGSIDGDFQLKAISYTSESMQKWLPFLKVRHTAIRVNNHIFEADIEYKHLNETKVIEGLQL